MTVTRKQKERFSHSNSIEFLVDRFYRSFSATRQYLAIMKNTLYSRTCCSNEKRTDEYTQASGCNNAAPLCAPGLI